MINRNIVYGLIVFLFTLFIKIYFVKSYYDKEAFKIENALSNGDASHYLIIGKNIKEYHTYSDNNSSSPTEYATWRPPVWPFVLSVFYLFTSSPLYILLFKILFESLIFLGIFLIFEKITESRVKPYFLFLLLIEPHYLKYSVTFLSESLSAILLLLVSVYFVYLVREKKTSLLFPVISALAILCHPVSVFFVGSLFSIYVLFNIKSFKKEMGVAILVMVVILSIWPIRNSISFGKGMYLTASQGATFSKGWNDKLAELYTNTDGDLADETLNLKYGDFPKEELSVLDYSKLYKKGTINYIKQASFQELFQIVKVKLRSNFNPIPEKPKAGNLESLGTFFRFLFLIVFVQSIVILIRNIKLFFSNNNAVPLVVLSVLVGQVVMSIYIYTGIRFNSIYGMVLTFSFFYINKEMFNNLIQLPLKVFNKN